MMPTRWIVALATVAVASLLANAYLVTRPSPAPVVERPPLLQPGAQLNEVRGYSEIGDLVQVRLAGKDRPTLMYVVTPTCIWCIRNRDNFVTLARERGGAYDIVLVSLRETGFKAYVDGLKPMWGASRVRTLTGLSEASAHGHAARIDTSDDSRRFGW